VIPHTSLTQNMCSASVDDFWKHVNQVL